MRITRQTVVKAYVTYCLCMDSDVFIRIFGNLTSDGAQIAGFQSANPVLLLFSLLLIGWTAILLLPIGRRAATVLLNVPWLTGLYLWSLASFLWAVQPATVLRLGVPLCAYLLCGVIAAHYLTCEDVARLVGNLTFGVALLSVVWEWADPVRGTLAEGWTGVYGEKNHLGMGMGVGCIALLVIPGRWTFRRVAKLAMCGVMLVGSQSMTAILFVAVAALLYSLLRLPARAQPLGFSVALAAFGTPLLLVPGAIGKAFAFSGKTTTFTGRDVIWGFVLEQWRQRPLLGFGYANFWVTEADRIQQNLGWNPGSAHNGFLETLVSTGLGGFALLLGALATGLVLVWKAWRQGAYTPATWLLLAWTAMLIDDLTEADFMVPAPLWFTYCLVLFLVYAALHPERTAVGARLSPRWAPPGTAAAAVGA